MYLSEADATPELKDHILAFDPEKVRFTSVDADYFAYYLSFVKKLVRLLNKISMPTHDYVGLW